MKIHYKFAALPLLLSLMLGAASAEDKVYVMKLGLAAINEQQHEWCKRFVGMVEKDSGGKIKGEIYPASQLGSIPREIEGVQFGAIQGFVGPPEFLAGIDERYEVASAPGLVTDIAHELRVVKDPEMQKLLLGFGADKGIHGVALFLANPDTVISRAPIRHLADFKGKKLRVLATDMQQEMVKGLGATPIAMSLGDVLPALQQGAIDGALSGIPVYTTMKYWDAAKYVTEINQPVTFSMAFISRKWFEALPKDLQAIIDADAAKAAAEINPWQMDFYEKQSRTWSTRGELISLPSSEQADLMKTLVAVASQVAKRKPRLSEALTVFAAVANRTR